MNHLVQHSQERQAELAEQMNVSPHDDSKLDRQGIFSFETFKNFTSLEKL